MDRSARQALDRIREIAADLRDHEIDRDAVDAVELDGIADTLQPLVEAVERVAELMAKARADHETHDPAPAVHVEDLAEALHE